MDSPKSIYLIADGEVLISKGKTKIPLTKLKSGDCFGITSILSNKGPVETVTSLGFSSIYSIDQNEFLSIIKESPSDYVIFIFLSFDLYLFIFYNIGFLFFNI